MVKKYQELDKHPEWKDLEELCSQIERLKEKAKKLRAKINLEVGNENKK